MASKKHRGRLIFGILFALILIWVFVFLWQKSRPKQQVWNIVTPTTETIQKTIVATGAVEPRDEVLIKPQISGIISEIYFEAGQKIKAGEVIAKIQVVPEMGQLNQAENNVRTSQLRLTRTRQEFDRAAKLFEGKVLSQEEFDAITSELALAQADHRNAQNNLEIVRTGVMAGATGNTQVRATISGTILDIPIKVGNSVIQSNTFNDGTTIASVADMGDMIFRGKIDETEVSKVSAGTTAKIVIGALQETPLDATLEYVAPKGVAENGVIMFEIKAAVAIPDSIFIRSGYSANAEVVTARADSVLAIPESSVIFDGDKSFVEVLVSGTAEAKDQKFERKEVKLGLSDGVVTQVLSGLTKKDQLKGEKKVEGIGNETDQ